MFKTTLTAIALTAALLSGRATTAAQSADAQRLAADIQQRNRAMLDAAYARGWANAGGQGPAIPPWAQSPQPTMAPAADPRYGDCLQLRYGILAGLHKGEVCTPEMAAQAQAQLNYNAALVQSWINSLSQPTIVQPQVPLYTGPSYCGGSYGRGSFQMNCQ
jgi:hypothetical protein